MGVEFVLIAILATCDAAAMAVVAKAAARAEAFDLAGALEIVRGAGDCDEAAGAAEYLEGLAGARDAVAQGGTVDSLREVRSATNALSRRSEEGGRRWEAASLALRAVAAASQSERGEMAIYLAEAMRVERMLLDAGLPGAPFVTVHELAGDLWLQVHQFEDARAAYLRAAQVVGPTPRSRLGLARVAERLGDVPTACAEYRALVAWWESAPRAGTPPEIAGARGRLDELNCRPDAARAGAQGLRASRSGGQGSNPSRAVTRDRCPLRCSGP
ncbi:MAG: tetratricopeptide repeat protein [Vicinamibacterales bacterium]